jgi:DNA repair exonuclease SbcCD ATPase subunit
MSSRKLKFHNLTMQNFLSYGNNGASVCLDNPGTTQIQGKNLDNIEQGVGANGTGKTTIINALVYALYGEPLSDIKMDDLINDVNKKECVVSVTFTLDDDYYEITRYRKMKTGPEGTYVTIYKNNETLPENNLAKANIVETNVWVEQLLDMPKDLFTRLVVYDADQQSFFNLPAAKQRDIMENLFQLTILSEKAESIKEQQKDSKGKLAVEEVTIESLTRQIVIYNEQITKAKERVAQWDNTRKADIDTYRDNMLILDAVDIEQQRQIFKRISEIEQQISEIDTSKMEVKNAVSHKNVELENLKQSIAAQVTQLRSQFKVNQQQLQNELLLVQKQIQDEKSMLDKQMSLTKIFDGELKTLDTLIDNNKSKINKLNDEISKHEQQIQLLHKNECPECGQQVPDAKVNIDKHQSIIDDKLIEITKFDATINECLDGKIEIEKERQVALDNYQIMIQDSTQPLLQIKISTIKDDINNIDRQETDAIAQYKLSTQDDIEKINEQINQLKLQEIDLQNKRTQLIESKPSTHLSDESQLARLEVQKQNLRKQLNDLEQSTNPHLDAMDDLVNKKPDEIEYTNINQLKKLIDHQMFLIKALTDKKSFIRKKLISKRLPYLNERLTHYLKNMGLPYQVTFNSDLTPSIAKRGTEKSFGNLSHGQKARVNFALSFAFRDVLERMHRSVNICLLDEVLDKALCSVGANAAVTLINEKAREDGITIFVITHKSELSTRFNKHITVVLEKGFSSIEVVD